MVRLSAAWAAVVMESASSRITNLYGGHGRPLELVEVYEISSVHKIICLFILSQVDWVDLTLEGWVWQVFFYTFVCSGATRPIIRDKYSIRSEPSLKLLLLIQKQLSD